MRFDELDLEDEVLDGIDAMNFQEMTPVQEQTIPIILDGRDIIACAQTGTGKTAAYTLPLLNRLLLEGNEKNVVKSVIIVPTRELAQQIDMQFQGFSYYMPVSTAVIYGGGDGRVTEVRMTTEGRTLLDKLTPMIARLFERATEGLTHAELTRLVATLQIISANLSRSPLE